MKSELSALFSQALSSLRLEPESPVVFSRPKLAQHGDLSCNVALQLAKALRRNPRELAAEIISALPTSVCIQQTEVAGGGFINIFLSAEAKRAGLKKLLDAPDTFGHSNIGGGAKVLLEFVSANPTGPLHVGHGRGAAFGASLANILKAAGFAVTSEYYVNDAGRQMDILTLSVWLRYLEMHGIYVPFPANAYQGDYVTATANEVSQAHGDRYVHEPWTILDGAPDATEAPELHLDALIANAKRLLGQDYHYILDLALTEQLGDARNDLLEFNVPFDVWFSERSLFQNGMLETTLKRLDQAGVLYRQDGAVWFRSTDFGDEKDRVLQRENGQYTYFASDIAYHLNKLDRGFECLIDVWGADHHGYIPRVKGALLALGAPADRLNVVLVQFAVLYRGKEKVAMSTRAGSFVTLRALREEVGNDAARFFYVLRKSDQHLDFDLELAKSQSNDNPVYYIQYAHARICSVLKQWDGSIAALAECRMIERLEAPHEFALLQRLEDFPEVVEDAARNYAPHVIAYYLRDVASDFHTYYNAHPFLTSDAALTEARLALIYATRIVLRKGLALLGVSAPETM